ncbi:MAG TPA: hypothetical protein DHV62_00310 [Elusimicrobia bacterium]|jgi:ribosomal-protein-alanine N-acetyltransferase|nr:hypothetical protein [Elusimicrobiota bacterium]
MVFANLRGKRINLIPISKDGLADMHEYSIKSEFYRYLEYKPFKTVEETKRYLEKLIEITKSKTGHYWFIVLKGENKIIGTFGVVNIDRKRRSAEIGYGVSPAYWGQGYFSEALMMVLKHLFIDLRFHRIFAKTRPDNLASIEGLEKAGLKKEGVMRDFYLSSNGRRYDAAVFSILRDEFLKDYKNLEGSKK